MVKKATISQCVLSLGKSEPDVFAQYVERWFDAVENMNPRPDEICIGYFEPDVVGVTQFERYGVTIPVKLVPMPPDTSWADILNATIEACSSDWFSWIGLDDVALLEAFTDLQLAEQDGAEIMSVGCAFSTGGQWIGNWDPAKLLNEPTIPGNSPIRKSAWERVGGYGETDYHDWALWLKLAKDGVKVYRSEKLGMLFHEGENHPTMSGTQAVDKEEKGRAFREYAKQLGFPL
jgi:hypothetical protein